MRGRRRLSRRRRRPDPQPSPGQRSALWRSLGVLPLDTGRLGRLLISATRYALQRETYIVRETCEDVRALWPMLAEQDRATIRRDVHEALDRDARSLQPLGQESDRREWSDLLAWMDA